MLNTSLSPWPSFSVEEADAVRDVLLSNKVNYWTGDEGKCFEKEFAEWCGVQHAIAVSNGTLALVLALKALGIKEGDEVIVTPRSFIASVSCIVEVGATPIFADVEADSGNISEKTIKPAITPRTKAIICVHLAGWPCDMDPIMGLANQHNLVVIEDCAQAHGARYKGKSVGSIGHVGAWSFCQDKIMTTGGEGGMVTTNDENLWRKMWAYKEHGKSYASVYERDHPEGFRWLHDSFGSNFRMTEMQSKIGRLQLKKMADWHVCRTKNAERIIEACRQFPSILSIPTLPKYIEHAWYKCYVYIKPEGLTNGWTRDEIIKKLISLNIPCFSGSCSEIYQEKAFEGSILRPKKRLEITKTLGKISLMFLVHPSLTNNDIEKVCMAIRDVFSDIVSNTTD